MTYECSVELLEAIDGLVGEEVEPCSGEASKGGREHAAFGDVDSTIKIQGGLEARDVIMGVCHPVIPFLKDFQAGMNCLLNCEGEGVVDLILIGVPVPTISLISFWSLMIWSRSR